MDKMIPKPKKRKPIRTGTESYEEIKDNIKNDATCLRSKTTKDNSDDENIISDDENNENNYSNLLNRRSGNQTQKIDKETKNQERRRNSLDNKEKNKNTSRHSQKFLEDLQKNSRENQQCKTPSNKWSESKKAPLRSSPNNNLSIPKFGIIGIIILFGIYFYFDNINIFRRQYLYQDNSLNLNSQNIEINNVKSVIKNLRSKYQNQNQNLWKGAYLSIKNLLIEGKKKPSIIVLLGKNSDPVDCLAVLLGNVSSNALNTGTLHLTPERFENDVGSVIERFRKILKEKKVVIIWDLLNINTEALKAFHNLCDTINPLVDDVIYIITIIADNYDEKEKPLEFIEKELFKRLSGKIKDDAIQPLITRITDGTIITVQPEPTITDCPLPKVTKS